MPVGAARGAQGQRLARLVPRWGARPLLSCRGHLSPVEWCARGQRTENCARRASHGALKRSPMAKRQRRRGATDGARPATDGDSSRHGGDSSRPWGFAPWPRGSILRPRSDSRGPESARAACYMLAVRGRPRRRRGGLTWPSDGLLGGVAAARGAATLTPPARHRAVIRASVWSAEPGLMARGQLQRPCKHGAHGGLEAAVACLWDGRNIFKMRPAAGAAWYIFFEGKGPYSQCGGRLVVDFRNI